MKITHSTRRPWTILVETCLISSILVLGIILFPELQSLVANLKPAPLLIIPIYFVLRDPPKQSGWVLAWFLLWHLVLQWKNGAYLDFYSLMEPKNAFEPVLHLILLAFIALWAKNWRYRLLQSDLGQVEMIQKESRLRQALQAREDTLDELSQRLMERGDRWIALQDYGKGMLTQNEISLRLSLLRHAQVLFGARRLAWYMQLDHQGESTLTLIQSLGQSIPLELPLDQGMASQALIQGSLISAVDIHDRSCEYPLCMGIREEQGMQTGVIVIFDLLFAKLHRENIRQLKIAAEWCSLALQKSKAFEILEQSAIWNPQWKSYNLFYLQQMVRKSVANCLRYGGGFSLCRMESKDRSLNSTALRHIEANVILRLLREGDLLSHGQDQVIWWIFLPSTPQKGAEVVMEKIKFQLESFFAQAQIQPEWSFRVHEWQGEKKAEDLWQKCLAP